MSKIPAELVEKWTKITKKAYKDQAKWVMNGFWDKLEKDNELIWQWVQKFGELDQEKKHAGSELDEFWSHKFLETLGETMTVVEMREKFRTIDLDFNKKVSIIEWLCFRYGIKTVDVCNAPQGENREGIMKAQAMVEAAQQACEAMTKKLADAKASAEAAKKATQASKEAAAKAKAAADASKKAAEAAWFAEQENKKALDELAAQEKAFNDKKSELERTKGDSTIGVVKRNKAANELDQLMAEDPLPLRKAKINQAATVKKSEKATAAANEAKAKAEAEAKLAEDAAAAAEAAEKAAVEAETVAQDSVKEAEDKLQEALNFLEEQKAKGDGNARGDIWWMQREIQEKKKYLPASKQK